MNKELNSDGNISRLQIPSITRVWMSALCYLAGKALITGVTIFVGVYLTVLLANQPPPRGIGPARSPFEISLEDQIDLFLRISVSNGTIDRLQNGIPNPDQLVALEKQLREDAGLELPKFQRYLLWTIKALTFNWGELTFNSAESVRFGSDKDSNNKDIVLESLPNTLLLVGLAYLIIFSISMPLSLYLARNYGNWLDRIFAALSPVSSVPSWVIAILLITLFAVKLRWLPVGGKINVIEVERTGRYMLNLIKHMILPVSAIVLSLLFQVVFTWRTFFILYSEEDYVDLARAKGLPARILENRYILRPALPYVMTSFSTILIGFWQLTVALEAVFQWPGIGWLYIKEALPNYWGETIYPGQLILVIEIVVIFAYLLGSVVFILDLAYVLVDPRIHLLPPQSGMRGSIKAEPWWKDWQARLRAAMEEKVLRKPKKTEYPERARYSWTVLAGSLAASVQNFRAQSRLFFHEIRKYPSAIFGLIVIAIMFVGSIYAVVGLPYEQFGREFSSSSVTGKNYLPSMAMPAWTNLFSPVPRLSKIIINEDTPQTRVTLQALENDWVEKTTTFIFNYVYKEIPSDVFIYLDSEFQEKMPLVSLTWITPDGRSINLKSTSVAGNINYDFEKGVSVRKLISQNPEWKNWFVLEDQYPTPAFQLLFAEQKAAQPIPVQGNYRLEIKSLLFEQGSDIHPELVLLGQVYGVAGTDYWRRDLVVPLLWGMPFALLIGLFGTFVTLFAAIFLPAVGVWYGGWLDDVIQRLTEINMVLPGLTIAVLAYTLFGINIWVILGVIVILNAFGAPIKTFRSALLQAKEAPYMEAARAYGVGNFRIITRYLVPRILPVLIPQLVTQIPSFIFLEATLGLFNIKSNYPTWGRVIYEGLSRGALYGSPFWVLAPISLLLLTGLAFAMLGSALERILNPRMLDQIPGPVQKESNISGYRLKLILSSVAVLFLLASNFIPVKDGKSLANFLGDWIKSPSFNATEKMDLPVVMLNPSVITPLPTDMPVTVSPTLSTPAHESLPAIHLTRTPVAELIQPATEYSRPAIYLLQANEFPYCIARRFNVDPTELLSLNGLNDSQTFYIGMSILIPQTGNPFPFERVLRPHPSSYVVYGKGETIQGVACLFGDVDPDDIAQVNQIPVDSVLFIGQQLIIP